jgi:hypothetical protein
LLLVPTAYVFISPFHISSRFSFPLQILAWRLAGFRSGSLLGSLLGLRLALCSTPGLLLHIQIGAGTILNRAFISTTELTIYLLLMYCIESCLITKVSNPIVAPLEIFFTALPINIGQ